MVRQCHDGMLARLQNDRVYTLPFPAIHSKKEFHIHTSSKYIRLGFIESVHESY